LCIFWDISFNNILIYEKIFKKAVPYFGTAFVSENFNFKSKIMECWKNQESSSQPILLTVFFDNTHIRSWCSDNCIRTRTKTILKTTVELDVMKICLSIFFYVNTTFQKTIYR